MTPDTMDTMDPLALDEMADEEMPEAEPPMELSELAVILASDINAAKETERTVYTKDRQRAIEYYLGEMPDTKPPDGRSKAMSRDVADTIDWILPGLMRVFFSGDKIVEYLPGQAGDEAFTEQATEYINYKFLVENEGYKVCWDAFSDALTVRVGIIKFWWDDTPEWTFETYSGLTDDAYQILLSEEGVEVESEETSPEQGENGEQTAIHDLKLRRLRRPGRIMIESVPPEEFLIDSDATSISTARFLCHWTTKTRSDLVEAGFDRDKIDEMPHYGTGVHEQEEKLARQDDFLGQGQGSFSPDRSMQEVEIFECYARVDMDRDGVAEWMRVLLGGGTGEDNILLAEEWGDPVP